MRRARDTRIETVPASRSRSARTCSALAIALLVLFCLGTRWGQSYITLAAKSWGAWKSGRQLTIERRRAVIYDGTYAALLYIREMTPPDAVILLPPFRDGSTRPG